MSRRWLLCVALLVQEVSLSTSIGTTSHRDLSTKLSRPSHRYFKDSTPGLQNTRTEYLPSRQASRGKPAITKADSLPQEDLDIAFVDIGVRQSTQFLGGAMKAVEKAFAGNTASQKENCVGCNFVWKKIHAGLDQSAGYDLVKNTFERVCMNMPDVYYDVCDMMFDQENEMVQDYLNDVKFDKMCQNAGVCWSGLCVPAC